MRKCLNDCSKFALQEAYASLGCTRQKRENEWNLTKLAELKEDGRILCLQSRADRSEDGKSRVTPRKTPQLRHYKLLPARNRLVKGAHKMAHLYSIRWNIALQNFDKGNQNHTLGHHLYHPWSWKSRSQKCHI